MDTKDKDQEIIDRSEAIAIQYLKETYDLDVTIIEKKILPKMAMSWVTVSGHVTDRWESYLQCVSWLRVEWKGIFQF